PDLMRKKRKEKPDESVNAHLGKHAGQHHRHAGRRAFVGIGQPGMKRKERYFDREPEKDSGKRKPREFPGKQSVPAEHGEHGEIESSSHEINSEEREQHRDAPEKCVNEELRGGAIAVLTAPDFDEQERRDQAHLVKQKPENKILGGEGTVE